MVDLLPAGDCIPTIDEIQPARLEFFVGMRGRARPHAAGPKLPITDAGLDEPASVWIAKLDAHVVQRQGGRRQRFFLMRFTNSPSRSGPSPRFLRPVTARGLEGRNRV